MNILHVIGARPNFMKAAPLLRALKEYPEVTQTLVHTGQHYDRNMSAIFIEQLGMPAPDINLEVGSGSHTVQTAQVMMRFEEVALRERPDYVVVYGDVNSTVAAALVSAKLGIPVAHVEAGLRSRDRTMPEEINRIITDQLADLLFTPSPDGDENLLNEGIAAGHIRRVGNVMIDTLIRLLPQAQLPTLPALTSRYALVTLHRPSNVDDPVMLARIMQLLTRICEEIQVVFPIHPRTRRRLVEEGVLLPNDHRCLLLDPLGYLEFLALQRQAAVVITDSGGIQEETTYLGVPCLTLRENTERPITVTEGTNVLIGHDFERLLAVLTDILANRNKPGRIPALWDGHAGERIARVLVEGKCLQLTAD